MELTIEGKKYYLDVEAAKKAGVLTDRKKTVLISCLQQEQNNEGQYYFYVSDYEYGKGFRSLKLLVKNVFRFEGDSALDLIASVDERTGKTECIFLGHWNDGPE